MRGPKPKEIRYEVKESGDGYKILYAIYWPNEIHPNKIFHLIYELFRKCYFGSEIDIEPIEVFLDKDGKIQKVFFETEGKNKDDPYFPKHTLVEIFKKDGKWFKKMKGVVKEIESPFYGDRFLVEAKSWNHIYKLYSGDATSERFDDLPLSYIDEQEYLKNKFSRRGLNIKKVHLRES